MNQEYFYRLISLPLFIGLTRDDALNMAGQARFGFRRPKMHERIVREGQECRELIFAIQGNMRFVERAADGSYTLEEYTEAPLVIQPERLFGRNPRYTRDAYAHSEGVQLLYVSKEDVRDILFGYQAFHLNYLNCVCSRQQAIDRRRWMPAEKTLRSRFVGFIQNRCEYPAGHKRIDTGMADLAVHLCASRLYVSQLLHDLQEEGLLSLQRGSIDIPHLEKLC